MSTKHALVGFVAVLGALGFMAGGAAAQETWTPTGDMVIERRDHIATLLIDGRVLIVGWYTRLAELYDPGTGTFSPAGYTLFSHGQGPTATRLLDGRVLIVGGDSSVTFTEIYDPLTGNFSQTGSLNVARRAHTATLLADGRVLIAGGLDASSTGTLASAELFDPAAGTFTFAGNLNIARFAQTAALLPNGKVLVAGGEYILSPGFAGVLSSAELFDPLSDTFSPTGDLTTARCCAGSTETQVLGNGKALVLGGFGAEAGDLYDPATGTFSATGNLNIRRGVPSASLLPDGRVLVAGGAITLPDGTAATTNTAETYDPATDTFTQTASMNQARQQHAATRLSNGQVLVTGGGAIGSSEFGLKSAELFSITATVAIDIKPEGFPNSIYPGRMARIPVAILTSDTFDASSVDATTVRFGATGSGAAPAHWALEDVDGDRDADMILQFNIQDTGIVCGTTAASLTGQTIDGQTIKGSDSIRTVGCQ